MTDRELELKAVALRRTMWRLIVNAGAGHTGGGAELTAKYTKYAKAEKTFWFCLVRVFRVVRGSTPIDL